MKEYCNRKKIRLNGYDYSKNGYYYITVCTKNRQPLFWKNIVGADIIRPNSCSKTKYFPELSEYGKIADTAIKEIPLYYSNVRIDEYVIMPDHLHMILEISNDENGRMISAPTTVMTIVGQMKRWVSKKIGSSIWQKSFYEHIIRNDTDYQEIKSYIINNPLYYSFQKE
ncbi:MAG: transposase [Clostridia bacterium]|nr:transposase [Clostridia bacterium]